ncbi:LysR substrate-binding domain-containing protein [Nonomuraea sp. NPDC050394]|uniref:LysR substrate-binding domain-containing protein n=1 Tax=Nonomuraea sp. NPDC050394 TaxID=3364363 RepID=UPI0037A54BB3
MRGTVRVGILQSLAFDPLCDVLTDFHVRRPQMELRVTVEPRGSVELHRAVQQGALDVAFVALPDGVPPDVRALSVGHSTLAVVLPHRHRLASRPTIEIDELAGEAFVDYPLGWGIRQKVDRIFTERELVRSVAPEDRRRTCLDRHRATRCARRPECSPCWDSLASPPTRRLRLVPYR